MDEGGCVKTLGCYFPLEKCQCDGWSRTAVDGSQADTLSAMYMTTCAARSPTHVFDDYWLAPLKK